jgi:hypothetical protein
VRRFYLQQRQKKKILSEKIDRQRKAKANASSHPTSEKTEQELCKLGNKVSSVVFFLPYAKSGPNWESQGHTTKVLLCLRRNEKPICEGERNNSRTPKM